MFVPKGLTPNVASLSKDNGGEVTHPLSLLCEVLITERVKPRRGDVDSSFALGRFFTSFRGKLRSEPPHEAAPCEVV